MIFLESRHLNFMFMWKNILLNYYELVIDEVYHV
jgi:hypothetical protein